MADTIKLPTSIYERYARFKTEFGKLPISQSGNNAKFGKYPELKDFSNQADELMLKNGLCYVEPTWHDDQLGKTWVTASIVNIDDPMQRIDWSVENYMSDHASLKIQCEGGTITYYRRFMKALVCGLLITDAIDSQVIEDRPKEEPKATAKQVAILKEKYDAINIAKMLQYYQVERIEDMTVKQASEAISGKKATNE